MKEVGVWLEVLLGAGKFRVSFEDARDSAEEFIPPNIGDYVAGRETMVLSEVLLPRELFELLEKEIEENSLVL